MATSGSRGRLENKQESEIMLAPLDNKDTLDAIKTLSEIFHSCYGPDAFCKNIHNNSGGHVSVTSQSSRLLQSMTFRRPIIRLVAAGLQSHIAQNMDHGLFAGRLALYLIQSSLDLGIHRHTIMEMFSLLSSLCLLYLESPACDVKFRFSDVPSMKIKELIKLVKGVISTKPLCGLCDVELEHICRLSLEVYLSKHHTNQRNDKSYKNVHYVLLEGLKPCESRLVDGFLFQTPNIPVYAAKAVRNMRRMCMADNVTRIRTLLVCTSMAGDCEAREEVTYMMATGVNLEQTVVERLMEVAKQLVDDQVGLVACQKVVHPEVRQYLESHDVIVLDRLGSAQLPFLHGIAGGSLVSSLTLELTDCYGTLDDIRHCVYADVSYVQLSSHCSDVTTVLLANRSGESLAELKAVFESSQYVLSVCDISLWYLAGAGCWQTSVACHIRNQAYDHIAEWSGELEAPRHVIQSIIDCFTYCLMRAALPLVEWGQVHAIDTTHAHHFCLVSESRSSMNCSCGMIKSCKDLNIIEIMNLNNLNYRKMNIAKLDASMSACDVIDCYAVARNALQCGVNIATMAIGVVHVVTDSS